MKKILGPVKRPRAASLITSVICYVASVVVLHRVMVSTPELMIQGDLGSSTAQSKGPIFADQCDGKIKHVINAITNVIIVSNNTIPA